jgi:virulence-associated protein VapD
MFAIAFDLVVADTLRHHPKSVPQAYADIGFALAGFGFDRVQGSLYTTPSEDLANLFGAITALKALPRFPCRAMVGFYDARKIIDRRVGIRKLVKAHPEVDPENWTGC